MTPLATELMKEEYLGLSDQEVANVLSNRTVVVRRQVETWLIKKTAIEAGYFASLVIASGDRDISIEKRSLAISILSWIDDPTIQTCDMDLQSVKMMIMGLVAYGFITNEQAFELDNLATSQISWAKSVGINEPIGIGLVHNARVEIKKEQESDQREAPLEEETDA